SGNKRANTFLAIVIFGITVRVAKSIIGYYIPLVAWQRNIGISGIFLAGPFLWFYGMMLLGKSRSVSKLHYLHLLPFAIFVILLFVIPSDGKFSNFWNYGIVTFHLLIYLTLAWILLFQNRKETPKISFTWYKNILSGVTVIWFYYLCNFLNITPYYVAGPIFYTFLIYALSYLFLNRQNLGVEKYSRSSLEKSTSKEIFQKLTTFFRDQNISREPNITLQKIAEKLEMSPRIVSQVINENSGQNFNDFVNQYRIENAQLMLRDPKYANEKIATIGFEAGFGTVTSFNVAFKNKTGVTPSEYRKKHLTD
ncbi:MAG: hypothetical protein JWQ30_724, partial [Sediminibacterium sp.]|nr:hypothetical protein [Sediminibacterium sp.]